jgi:hypothetical protein
MKPNTALDEWVEMTRASIDEQLAELAAKDGAAWLWFRETLLGPLDEWTGDFER